MFSYYSISDLFLVPLFFLVFMFIGRRIKLKNIENHPEYKYFTNGLLLKLLGALSVCVIYSFYYQGGDTTIYHQSAFCVVKVLFNNVNDFFSVWLGDFSSENFSVFTNKTGFPTYWGNSYAYAVVRLIVPLEILTGGSFPVTAMLCSVISYYGIWKMYRVFCEIYPELRKQFAIAILFIPSVFFWGSGILKDTFTLGAACLFVYSFYRIFMQRRLRLGHFLQIIIAVYIMISIKPYIFLALLPGSFIWWGWNRIIKVKGFFTKLVVTPVMLIALIGIIVLFFTSFKDSLGVYGDIDSLVAKASITQRDLIRVEAYGENSFNIGEYDENITGILSKFPAAVFAGLYRPLIIDAKNVVMVLSGLENAFLLLLSIFTLFRVRSKIVSSLFASPLALYCFIFAVFFAFSVGFSTANYGALVRYKIPSIPFLLASLYILRYKSSKKISTKITG